jgi:hypothetical protein
MLDDELKRFLESDVAIVVGTCDGDLAPEIVRAFAARVAGDSKEIQLFVGRAASERTLANLLVNRRVSVTFCSPENYRTVQIKGWFRDIQDARPEDQAIIDRYKDAFVATVAKYGLSEVIRNIWGADPIRLSFEPESIFEQTPGPGAGRPL